MIISIVSGSDFGAQSINQQSIRKELAEVRDKVNSLVDMLDSSGLGQNEERRPVDNSECVLAVFPLHHDHCCPSSSQQKSAIVIKSPSESRGERERGREAADLAMAQQSESAQCHNDTVVSKVTYSQQHSHIVTRSRTFIFVF